MRIAESRIAEYVKTISPAPCPLCHSQNWTLTGHVFQIYEHVSSNPDVKNENITLLTTPLICTKCGYTHFINPLVSGLLDSSDIPTRIITSKDKE